GNPAQQRWVAGLLPPPTHIAVPDLPLTTLKAYPNPAVRTVQVTIEARADGPAFFRLYALDGRLLLTQQATLQLGANTSTIALPAGLATGVYQLQVQFNGQHVARNLVVDQTR
ncbi:MAG: T9SS type A sorting domain-containing protein, partial [Bacteroidota bacterium]